MSSKILNYIQKLIVVATIIVIGTTSATYAFTFEKKEKTNSSIMSLINQLFNLKQEEEYTLSDFESELEKMKETGNIDVEKIKELFNKLPSSEEKATLSPSIEMFSNISSIGSEKNIDIQSLLSKLLDTLINAIKGLISGIGGDSSLPVAATSVNMIPKTAVEFAGNEYAVNLHASVYMHVDENGNPDSDKWVLLLHPNSYNGEKIAKVIGPYYYEKGYNIFAPDLRGAGESEGNVSLGFLDSLDVYDWLTKLNEEYNTKEVIVHGISLGAATTNFLSGIDGFMNNGPTKISTTIKPLRDLKVIGLVEDCGYTDMENFSSKSSLISMEIGLTEDNFDYYSKATNSLQYCDLPMLIIHGTKDIIVKVENATTVKNTVKGEVEEWIVEGQNHAFIIMGQKEDEYREHVQAFIDKCTTENTQSDVLQEDKEVLEDNTNTNEEQEQQSFISKLLNSLKSFTNRK